MRAVVLFNRAQSSGVRATQRNESPQRLRQLKAMQQPSDGLAG